jgi:hypothetical protein
MSDENDLPNGTLPDDDHRENQGLPRGSDSLNGSRDGPDGADSRYDVAGAALCALSSAEEADLYAAAAVDPAVSRDLAAMEAVAAELARLAPVATINRGRSAGIRSRLVARAAATHAGRPVPKAAIQEIHNSTPRSAGRTVSNSSASGSTSSVSTSSRPQHTAPVSGATVSARQATGSHVIPFEPRSRGRLGRTLGTLALAAAVLITAFGIYDWRTQARRGGVETAAGAPDSSLAAQVASLRASVAQKDSLISALTGMHTRVIDLVAYNSSDPMARIFWDQKKQMFMMYASNVSMPPRGKTYQVWLMPRGAAPVSAGTFMPDSTGSAIMVAKQPMEPGALRRIAVTEEPSGGVASPSGPVVFAGVGR